MYSFDPTKQMRLMLFDWLLEGSHWIPATVNHADPIRIRLRGTGAFRRKDLQQAFADVSATRPFMALWLLPFKDGDMDSVLPRISKLLEQSVHRDGVRHGVFHWPPEDCIRKGLQAGNVSSAYRHAEFIFMHGYVDERLAGDEKFLPFPLGPALWRGWRRPSTVLRTHERPLLASYRGSSMTRPGIAGQIRSGLKCLGAMDRRQVVLEERGMWTLEDTELDQDRFRELMASSRFAIAPEGRNPNTYRIAEAVESGATPLMVLNAKGCYRNWAALYGHELVGATRYPWIPRAPFAILRTWAEIGSFLSSAAHDLDDATPRLRLWYSHWRAAFLDQLSRHIRNAACH